MYGKVLRLGGGLRQAQGEGWPLTVTEHLGNLSEAVALSEFLCGQAMAEPMGGQARPVKHAGTPQALSPRN